MTITEESWTGFKNHVDRAISLRESEQSFKVKRTALTGFSALVFFLENSDKAQGISRNNLKIREFGNQSPQHSHSEQASITQEPGASEDANFEPSPTELKLDSSGGFEIVVVALLKQKVGEGSFAKVKLGLDAQSGKLYAVAKRQIYSTPEDKNRIKQNHPYCRSFQERWESRRQNWEFGVACMKELYPITPQIIGTLQNAPGFDTSYNFLKNKTLTVMDYVSGGNLFDAIRNEVLGDQKENVARDLLFGVYQMHNREIAHLDLKPENIVLQQNPRTGEWSAHLIDFDFAQNTTNPLVKPRGSYEYMAPEMALIIPGTPSPFNPIPADLWSLGATLYSVFTGRMLMLSKLGRNPAPVKLRFLRSFISPENVAENQKWVDETISKSGNIPEDWKPVIQNLLRLDPSERLLLLPH